MNTAWQTVYEQLQGDSIDWLLFDLVFKTISWTQDRISDEEFRIYRKKIYIDILNSKLPTKSE